MTYKIYTDERLGTQMVAYIRSDAEPLWIPMVGANTDYQQYLAWLEAGNTPEPWNPDTINGGEE